MQYALSMSDRPLPTDSAPTPTSATDETTASAPKKGSGLRGRSRGEIRRNAIVEPDPTATDAESVIVRTRKILERLIRSAGYGWRDIDRMIHKNRGFTAHLLSKREGLPLNDVLAILDAIDVRYEDFFAVLFPKFDKVRVQRPVGEGMFELLGDLGVPEAPEENEGERDELSRALRSRLGRISALIDQRVLALMESALTEPLQQSLRPAARPAEPAPAAGGGPAGNPMSGG